MTLRWAVPLWALLTLIVPGCARPNPSAKTTAPPQTTPAVLPSRREQFHAAAFQVSGALDDLDDAMKDLRPIRDRESGDVKDALSTVIAAFDDAGGSVADYAEAPSEGDPPADADSRFKDAVTKLNDACEQILDAQGTLDDLLSSSPPAKVADALQDANDAGDDAVAALSEAVRQLGGKPVSSDEASPTAPHTP